MTNTELSPSVIDRCKLPPQFPTHRHSPQLWEQLGRTIAAYGFLEEVLGKAIFAFTATRSYDPDEIEEAYQAWIPQLERALTDQLSKLIKSYEKAVRANPAATIENLHDLVEDLKAATKLRNALCHGSWRLPDANGASVPFFVNWEKEVFETPIDIAFLERTQTHVAELACGVIDTVTHMGWQFPGGAGPGKPWR